MFSRSERAGIAALACGFGLALGAGPSLGAAQPSFNCATASSKAELLICADPRLARLDAEIARVYGGLLKLLDPLASQSLRNDQRLFVRNRDAAADNADEDLQARLQDRLALLRSIDNRDRRGFSGHWRSLYGSVTVVQDKAGGFAVTVETADPISARWLCNFTGSGQLTRDGMAVSADPVAGPGPNTVADANAAPPETTTLRLTRNPGVLSVEWVAADGADASEPAFCGRHGTVDGDFLPVVD